jgi:hypothetical protein
MKNQTEPNEVSPKQKTSLKRILIMLGIGILPLGIATIFIRVPPGCSCGTTSVGKAKITEFIAAQKAYFIENSIFAESYDLLKIPQERNLQANSTGYEFSVETNKEVAFMGATPKEVSTDLFRLGLMKESANSLVGAVAYDRKTKFPVSILCISEQQTLSKPPKPTFDGEKFTCPAGFKTQ